MKKLSGKSGSTLTYTLIIITVMSILALSVAMMVGISSKMKVRKYDTLKREITLENAMAEIIINSESYQSGTYFLNDDFSEATEEEATYRLKVTVDGNTTFLLASVDNELAIICELNEGRIIRWGPSKWSAT